MHTGSVSQLFIELWDRNVGAAATQKHIDHRKCTGHRPAKSEVPFKNGSVFVGDIERMIQKSALRLIAI